MNDTIKPIPKYMLKLILKADKIANPKPNGLSRYYAYLSKIEGELVKITVAVKDKYNKRYVKQCTVHGLKSSKCFVKDMCYSYMGGYNVGWFYEGLTKYAKWYESEEWGYCDDKYFDVYAPILNREYLNKFEEFKYSAVELYEGNKILQYLRLYLQYPQVEYLMKAGLSRFYDSKQILKLIEKDKKFRKWLYNHKTELNQNHCYVDVAIKAYKSGKDIRTLQLFKAEKLRFEHDSYTKPLRELFKGKDLERFFLYVQNQKTNYYSYLDYYRACEYLNIDMTLEKNLFPHNFKRWHDIRIDEYHTARAIEDEKKRKELYDKFKSIAEKYLPLEKVGKSSYIAIIAKSPKDLINEGEVLHHCVGRMNYDQRFIREETLIFFIRKLETPNIPLATVEYSLSKHKVLQCYGISDSKPNDDVQKFVNTTWLRHANKQLKQLVA